MQDVKKKTKHFCMHACVLKPKKHKILPSVGRIHKIQWYREDAGINVYEALTVCTCDLIICPTDLGSYVTIRFQKKLLYLGGGWVHGGEKKKKTGISLLMETLFILSRASWGQFQGVTYTVQMCTVFAFLQVIFLLMPKTVIRWNKYTTNFPDKKKNGSFLYVPYRIH